MFDLLGIYYTSFLVILAAVAKISCGIVAIHASTTPSYAGVLSCVPTHN